MLATLGSLARLGLGSKILYDLVAQLYPSQKGSPLDPQYQEFVDAIAKANQISEKILVRQDSGGSPSWVQAYHEGSLCTRNPQILIAKDRLKNPADLKFAIAHELGHICERHILFSQSILILNAALFAVPYVPIKAVLATAATSAILMIPIFRYIETRADDFAFANCPAEVIQGAFKEKSPPPSGVARIFGGNIKRRAAAAN